MNDSDIDNIDRYIEINDVMKNSPVKKKNWNSDKRFFNHVELCDLSQAIDVTSNYCDRRSQNRVTKKRSVSNILSGITLNVSNLSDKLKYGVIDEYFSKGDIITFVETKTDSPEPFLKDTFLQDFKCFSKSKPLKKVSYAFDGIHGISVLLSPRLVENSVHIEVIDDTQSECVLWILIKLKNGFNFIMGAVYVPGDQRADFKRANVFNDIESDVFNLKLKFSFPMFISGD